jgi:hypothetical protein
MALLSETYKAYYPQPQPSEQQPQQEMVALPPPTKQPAVGVRQIALMLLIGVLAIILVDSLINKYPSLQ